EGEQVSWRTRRCVTLRCVGRWGKAIARCDAARGVWGGCRSVPKRWDCGSGGGLRVGVRVYDGAIEPRASPWNHEARGVCGGLTRAARSLQPVIPDLVEQRARAELKELGGAGLVPARTLEGLAD